MYNRCSLSTQQAYGVEFDVRDAAKKPKKTNKQTNKQRKSTKNKQ